MVSAEPANSLNEGEPANVGGARARPRRAFVVGLGFIVLAFVLSWLSGESEGAIAFIGRALWLIGISSWAYALFIPTGSQSESEPANVAGARARARRAYFVGLGFIVPAFVLVGLSGESEGVIAFIGGALLVVGLSSWAYALFIRFRLRRGQVDDAIEATGGDEGSRVLYLRPFEQDADWGVYLPFSVWNPMSWRMLLRPAGLLRAYALILTGRVTWEQVLKAATRPVGKLIAIGEPGERMPTLGLKNEYVDDDGWQARVAKLVGSSQLVVIRAGASQGVMWEVETVALHVRPEALLIYVGQRSRKGADGGRKARDEFYREFRESASSSFPKGLPAQVGKRKFICFEADWTPVVHHKRFRGFRRPPTVRVANYMESVLL